MGINVKIPQNMCSTYFVAKEYLKMTENEKDLLKTIRESEDPAKVADYMISLFLDYLQKHVPSQEKPSVVPPVSA